MQGAYTTGGALSQPFIVFAVAKLDASFVNDGAWHFLIDGDDTSNRHIIGQYVTSTPDDWGIYAGTWLHSGASDSDWHIWTALYNGNSSEFWHEGTSQTSGAAGAHAPDGLTVGLNMDGAVYWKGDCAEIIIYDSNLSEADIDTIGNYLADRYDLTWDEA